MSHRRPAYISVRSVQAVLVCLAWIAGAFLASHAHADGPPGAAAAPGVAVIRIDITGDHPPGLMKQLDGALVSALANVGFSGIAHESVQASIEGKPGLADCASADCLRQLPPLLGANQFLRLRVEASSSIYEFEILLLVADDQGGSIKERRTGSCPVCTSDELIDQVSKEVGALMKPFQPVPVTIDSQPAGASLILDGRELGRAPFSGTLSPGSHQVRAVLDGHLAAEQAIEVAAGASGEPQRFEIGLTAAPSGGGGGGAGGGFGMWKWPTAVAAVAAVAVGGYWVSIQGDCVDEPVSDGGECKELYDTQIQGIVSIGAGAALGVAAGLMFWSDSSSAASESQSERAFAPAITPTRGGAVGTLRLRF
jgi:hypothetical protein